MIPEMAVSVVIPTIGRTSLRRAVESALQQTSPPMEVIVVVDAECEPDLPRSSAIRVVRTSGGVGASLAKHMGIESANGNVIALLDDDDVWRDDKLEIQLSAAPPGIEWIISCRFSVHVDLRQPIVGPRTLIEPPRADRPVSVRVAFAPGIQHGPDINPDLSAGAGTDRSHVSSGGLDT